MTSASSPGSIDEAIAWLRKAFRPDAAAEVRVTFQFDLAGEPGGGLWIRVEDGRLDVAEGATPAPDVTFRMSAVDFFGVLAGLENPDLLFMADRLVIEGDLSLALSLRKLFQARV